MLQIYQKYGITAERLNSTLAAICKLWETLKEFMAKPLEL